MCGIAGYYLGEGKASVAALRGMCDQIRHRGPDDDGYHVDGGCGIGMRRLSIIDLNTGHQPMTNEDESVWVVFNGEIYNYQELRRDLMARGHQFATNSDTETLVHLYEEQGAEGLQRLRGMFAFAIWYARRRRIFLARDRFGKKPLYYAVLPEGLYFGSELKCLRAAGVPQEIDPEALRLFFQFTYVPEPFTCFRAVRKLPPGCWLTYDADGTVSPVAVIGSFNACSRDTAGFLGGRHVRGCGRSLMKSVRIRMIADVPLGVLNGGIDSSSVVASAGSGIAGAGARRSPSALKRALLR